MPLLLLVLGIVLVGLFLYWQLVLAEGAYFGKGVVAWLYDLVAQRYNRIKQYDANDDARFLGEPLTLSLQGIPQPIVLDVATGTSRLPLALCRQPLFRGQIIALDNARRMLHEATRYVQAYRDRITWVWHSAVPLPFEDNTFDLVTCLEALEFMPSTPAALREFFRVLKPGGLLLITNRVGSGRRLMPGKTYRPEQLEALLQSLQQTHITTQVWQYDYDLVWSLKPGISESDEDRSSGPPTPSDLLRCPVCCAQLDRSAGVLTCRSCGRRYPIGRDGVIELLARCCGSR
jgi:ubiquinone/menaquinone biosynthesis C-methylase UbiE